MKKNTILILVFLFPAFVLNAQESSQKEESDKRVEQLINENKRMQFEIQDMRRELTTLQSENKSLHKELRKLRNETKSKEYQASSLSQANETEISSLNNELKILQGKLQISDSLRLKAETELRIMKQNKMEPANKLE